MITPTVGRMLHYYPNGHEGFPCQVGRPLAATIAHVWSDTCVNLNVLDANGNPHGRTSVYLAQPEAEVPAGGYCTWMPYQVGQAQKTEELERQLAEAQAEAEK